MPTGTLLIAHGSSFPEHAETIASLAAAVADAGGEVCVAAFLDHNAPTVADAVASLAHSGVTEVVAVPLLLSKAFHATVDVPAALTSAATTQGLSAHIADPVGPDEALGAVLSRRIDQATSDPTTSIVVFSAGTGSLQARTAFSEFVERWASAQDRTAIAAFVAGGEPSVGDAVAAAQTSGGTVVAAPFMLTDGALVQRGRTEALLAGAEAVADALGVSDELVAIVRQRRQACASI